jgi:hypothetical protein
MPDDFKRSAPSAEPPVGPGPAVTTAEGQERQEQQEGQERQERLPPLDGPDGDRGERGSERGERSISDFVRRAVSAGVVAASRSKDDIMRAAAIEVRGWLEHLNLHEEITKALAKMVIEVKTEIRFRPNDEGRIVPEATNDVKVKSAGSSGSGSASGPGSR